MPLKDLLSVQVDQARRTRARRPRDQSRLSGGIFHIAGEDAPFVENRFPARAWGG